ncbi:MAG TPA: hypothetical protein VLM79_21340 [Kofleriaceae bacterium]|nr:hypothetical protein [Kofleriaceae bacterium]
MKDGELSLHSNAALAVAFALAALGSACGGVVSNAKPDGGSSSGGPDGADSPVDGGDRPDPGGGGGGGPLQLGGGGPATLDLTCPELAMPTKPGTVFVDAASTGGDGSKAAPFATVAEALASAGDNGVIYVAAGTYRERLVIGDKNLTLYGGFATGFGARTDGCATILEAPSLSDTVLEASPEVRTFGLDGVTVQQGVHGLLVEADVSVNAMYTIANSVFADNGAPDVIGGGAFIDNASVQISRTVFRDNRGEKGAAIAHQGVAATLAIEGSLFERNIGHSDHGGALYLGPMTARIVRTTFRSNEIGKSVGYGWGGAVVVYKPGAAPAKADFAYNVFTDNLASVGGAVFIDDGASATMSHDLLYRNRSIQENGVARGAALYVDGLVGGEGSRLVADHLTIANNNLGEDGTVSESRGGGVYLESNSSATFTNSIFWNNGNEPLSGDPTCSISVSYSIVQGSCGGTPSCTIGAGVFEPASVDFVDEATNDYHEKSTAGHFSHGTWIPDNVSSPALDRADPAASAANEPAPNGARANLGVFGQTTEASKSR